MWDNATRMELMEYLKDQQKQSVTTVSSMKTYRKKADNLDKFSRFISY